MSDFIVGEPKQTPKKIKTYCYCIFLLGIWPSSPIRRQIL